LRIKSRKSFYNKSSPKERSAEGVRKSNSEIALQNTTPSTNINKNSKNSPTML
jgi:hypothetical protein